MPFCFQAQGTPVQYMLQGIDIAWGVPRQSRRFLGWVSVSPRNPYPSARGAGMATAPARVAIIWHRRDLRLHDNELYTRALAEQELGCTGCTHILPLLPIDASQLEPVPSCVPGATHSVARMGPHSARFLLQSAADLRASLRAAGMDLHVRLGRPDKAVPSFVAEVLGELRSGSGGGGSPAAATAATAATGTGTTVGSSVNVLLLMHDEPGIEETRCADAVEQHVAAMASDGVTVTVRRLWGCSLWHPDDMPPRGDFGAAYSGNAGGGGGPQNKRAKPRRKTKRERRLARGGGDGSGVPDDDEGRAGKGVASGTVPTAPPRQSSGRRPCDGSACPAPPTVGGGAEALHEASLDEMSTQPASRWCVDVSPERLRQLPAMMGTFRKACRASMAVRELLAAPSAHPVGPVLMPPCAVPGLGMAPGRIPTLDDLTPRAARADAAPDVGTGTDGSAATLFGLPRSKAAAVFGHRLGLAGEGAAGAAGAAEGGRGDDSPPTGDTAAGATVHSEGASGALLLGGETRGLEHLGAFLELQAEQHTAAANAPDHKGRGGAGGG